jgi:hypothetical protein
MHTYMNADTHTHTYVHTMTCRVAASLVMSMGLHELIARNLEDYVALAVKRKIPMCVCNHDVCMYVCMYVYVCIHV